MEHPDVTKRNEQDATDWRASKQIVVVGRDVPKPCLTFDEASMPEYILTEVLKQGFQSPTVSKCVHTCRSIQMAHLIYRF